MIEVRITVDNELEILEITQRGHVFSDKDRIMVLKGLADISVEKMIAAIEARP
jgi:hypothetical protein